MFHLLQLYYSGPKKVFGHFLTLSQAKKYMNFIYFRVNTVHHIH